MYCIFDKKLNLYFWQHPSCLLIIFTVVILVILRPQTGSADEYVKYKGLLGISGDFGLTRLQPSNLYSPEYVTGITGGIRVFYGITNTIGVEAMFHGSNLSDYTPIIGNEQETIPEETLPGIEPEPVVETDTIELPRVIRPQQQQYALGVLYVLDSFRLMPSFSLGYARVRTGAMSENYGLTVVDNHIYISGSADYKITPYLWTGFTARINIQLSDNAQYDRSVNLLFRISFVWQFRKLVSGIIPR